MHAYCYRSGHIDLGRSVPAGTLPLAKAPAKKLRDTLDGLARLAYDNRTLIVPGLPEATDDDAALNAVLRFRRRLTRALAA